MLEIYLYASCLLNEAKMGTSFASLYFSRAAQFMGF